MKKIGLFCLCLFAGASGMAQGISESGKVAEIGKGFYVRFDVGYSFGAGKMAEYIDDLDMPGYSSESDGDDYEYKRKAISLGKGVDLMYAAGDMFNPYIGVDVSLSTVFGGSNRVKEIEHVSRSTSELEYRLAYGGLFLTPAIRLQVPVWEDFSLYSRIGIALPLVNTAKYTESYTETAGRNSSDAIAAYRLNAFFRPGFNAVLGVDYAINDHWSVCLEVEAMVQSFAVKKKTLVQYEEDGENLLPDVDNSDRIVEYKRKINQETVRGISMSYNLPASSVGINVGFVYRF